MTAGSSSSDQRRPAWTSSRCGETCQFAAPRHLAATAPSPCLRRRLGDEARPPIELDAPELARRAVSLKAAPFSGDHHRARPCLAHEEGVRPRRRQSRWRLRSPCWRLRWGSISLSVTNSCKRLIVDVRLTFAASGETPAERRNVKSIVIRLIRSNRLFVQIEAPVLMKTPAIRPTGCAAGAACRAPARARVLHGHVAAANRLATLESKSRRPFLDVVDGSLIRVRVDRHAPAHRRARAASWYRAWAWRRVLHHLRGCSGRRA